MLDLAGEAAIALAQLQEQMAQFGETRGALRLGNERLGELAAELERLVDTRGVSLTGRRSGGEFDVLELDEFNELHTVSRRIAEASADGKLLEQNLDRHAHSLGDGLGHLERLQADLREAVMQSRMVAVSVIVPRLQRAVRQAARMSGKAATLAIAGEHTAIDAHLLQRLVDPLTHVLRNAVDHGIEPPEQREAAGKPPSGRIEISFARQGHVLTVGCRDDGRGLDYHAIGARAKELGLLDAGAEPSKAELARLILLPGFSTRREATQLSGRGIGMDVVQRSVHELRGTLRIESDEAAGTRVVLQVPQRLATVPVTVARAGAHVLALSIRGVEQILPADGLVEDDDGHVRFVVQDGFVAVHLLDELLGLPAGQFARELALERDARGGAGPGPQSGAARVAMLVRRDDGELVAVIAPDLGQTRNIVVRPLPSWLPRIAAIEGATVLGDGAVAPVIDLPLLLAGPQAVGAPVASAAPARRGPLCLVVDDSVSVRRSMETFLGDLGFEVDSAGDGVEALALVQRRVPDLAIVDLEMPRMNGVEFTAALRHEERTVEVPVIMITSRYSERHRAMALDAGVDVFMTKPYTEDELANHIRRCLERRAALG
jgi:chemosensory pili system protein ChpA (sensor histidine kinase/response regulator)